MCGNSQGTHRISSRYPSVCSLSTAGPYRPIILELLKADAEHRRPPNKTRKRKRDRSGTSRVPAPQSSEDDIESIAGPSNTTKTKKKKTRSPPLSSSIRGGGSGDDDRMDDEANGDDEEDVFEEDAQSVIPTSDSREEELENDVDNTGAFPFTIPSYLLSN
jgi:hypothetical protein